MAWDWNEVVVYQPCSYCCQGIVVASGYSFTGIALDMCSSCVLAAAAVDSEIVE